MTFSCRQRAIRNIPYEKKNLATILSKKCDGDGSHIQ